ncbi:hypothetical protein J6590_065918 [Homalodisca vitripennis]|nr:hypothetical protein J6590_065918 [Homalodisca vitripennis]
MELSVAFESRAAGERDVRRLQWTSAIWVSATFPHGVKHTKWPVCRGGVRVTFAFADQRHPSNLPARRKHTRFQTCIKHIQQQERITRRHNLQNLSWNAIRSRSFQSRNIARIFHPVAYLHIIKYI